MKRNYSISLIILISFLVACGISPEEQRKAEEKRIQDSIQRVDSTEKANIEALKVQEYNDSIQKNQEIEKTKNLEVKIGNQIWMRKNLDVVQFRNGDFIQHANNDAEWKYCFFNETPCWRYSTAHIRNSITNEFEYENEVLYNFFAVQDSRGLAPVGWHIPSADEWNQLSNYLGGDSISGYKMKSTEGWLETVTNEGNGSNSIGFNAFPVGIANCTEFNENTKNRIVSFWSSTIDVDVITYELNDYTNSLNKGSTSKCSGVSIRCIKD
jgi:uncharacterized protein (TIGR02145 family)